MRAGAFVFPVLMFRLGLVGVRELIGDVGDNEIVLVCCGVGRENS